METEHGRVGTAARPQARSCTEKVMKARDASGGAPLWKPHPGVNRNEEYWKLSHVSDNKGLWPSDTR